MSGSIPEDLISRNQLLLEGALETETGWDCGGEPLPSWLGI